ncbi:MAG: hypothetical protein IKS55_07775 [Oscillospiraceae bacterium]|nr:hypothetical protein [Oscillospiraceae bacterium]
MEIQWIDGFEIHVSVDNGTVVITANKEGLLSLAGQMTALADTVPGSHIHYDDLNSLEEGSREMIIEKRTEPGRENRSPFYKSLAWNEEGRR